MKKFWIAVLMILMYVGGLVGIYWNALSDGWDRWLGYGLAFCLIGFPSMLTWHRYFTNLFK